MTGFVLSARSLSRLQGVHPDLVRVVKRAITITEVDFSVLEGLRTAARQRELVAAGASKTMNSRHLTGHAVDLGAYVAGAVRWDWNLYFPIAKAMRQASIELGIPIRWGGAWKELASLPETITSANLSRTFPDGPHFELPSKNYPSMEATR